MNFVKRYRRRRLKGGWIDWCANTAPEERRHTLSVFGEWYQCHEIRHPGKSVNEVNCNFLLLL